ncbi:hypothetical protein Tdes44962_MAKER07044 [Teratosphaeria destructans]|uniref:Uncharacterized protein n=1 Tax=Teratosphaeria destructans TaxID=418781 RepID=A0A9W7T0E7_9PEZI|nr:hypothetical protein Tdes44962_MAKER07044 [Teratosphaeria destructans]
MAERRRWGSEGGEAMAGRRWRGGDGGEATVGKRRRGGVHRGMGKARRDPGKAGRERHGQGREVVGSAADDNRKEARPARGRMKQKLCTKVLSKIHLVCLGFAPKSYSTPDTS